MNKTASAGFALVLALALPAAAAPTDTALNVSGYMNPNADGTASFEFRIANDRADVTVTGFTVTVAFYDRTVAPSNKLAEYHWSFLDDVPPNTQRLEYGVLSAMAVADLVKRHGTADPLPTAVYIYKAKIDTEVP